MFATIINNGSTVHFISVYFLLAMAVFQILDLQKPVKREVNLLLEERYLRLYGQALAIVIDKSP